MKNYLLCFIFINLCVGFAKSQSVVYSATTQTGSRYNPANDSIAVFDDAILTVGSPTASVSLKVTQVEVGIRRLANAGALDVALYLGKMGSNKAPLTADSIFQTSLAVNGATSVTQSVIATNATGWNLNLDTISGANTTRGFFVGVRFKTGFADANNGWRICTAPTTGTADSTFFNVNVRNNTLSGPFLFTGTQAYFYAVVTGTVNIVAPVKLTYFKVANAGEGAKVLWYSEKEFNSDKYIVEASTDGLNFKEVGFVKATGAKQYSFDIAKLNMGTTYFRLKMLDLDGSYEYSPVQILNIKSFKSLLSVFPNPASSEIKFTWNEDGLYRFQITSLDGKQVKFGPVLKGYNQQNLSNLPSGNYLIEIINSKGQVEASQKISKL